MATIYMRSQALLPTVIMGETGIGKTALIIFLTYISDLTFKHYNIHAGITKNDIVETIFDAEEIAEKDQKKLVLFLDEINTNPNLAGLLKEIVIDRRVEGRKISNNVVLIAACNPYKLKTYSDQCLTAGLRKALLDNDRNYQLVYRVLNFPLAFLSYIQNYDTISKDQLA